MNFTIARKIALSFAFAFIVILFGGVTSFYAAREVGRSEALTQETDETLALIVDTERLMVAEEAAVRGFALSGHDELLEPRTAAHTRLPEMLARLRRLTADSRSQQQRLDELGALLEERSALDDAVIAIRRSEGRDRAAELFSNERQGVVTTRGHVLMRELDAEEDRLLVERTAAGRMAMRALLRINALLSTASLLIVALGAVWIRRAVTGPVERLVHGVEQIADGDLEVHVAEGANDELGRLARSFNLMVTKRRHAEERLRKSEARFRELFEQAPDGVFVTDAGGALLEVNAAGASLLGYTHEAVMTKTVHDILRPEDAEWREKSWAGRSEPGDTEVVELQLRRKDGTLVPTAVTARQLSDGRRQAFVRDITLQKQAEQAQVVLAEAGVVLASSLDFDELVSTIARFVAQRLNGLCVLEIADDDCRLQRRASAHPSFALPPESVVATIDDEVARRVFASKEVLLSDESIMVPLVIGARALGVLGFVSSAASKRYSALDLTLVKELAHRAAFALENARLYEAARRATILRDEVLAVVAHDLRNPLNAILMGLSCQGRRNKEPERRNQTALNAMGRSARRMERMIEDLLDISRVADGRPLPMNCGALAPATLVADAQEAQKQLTTRHHLVCEVADDLPDVWADRDRVSQIFANLISNALKFTPPDGVITIGAAARPDHVLFWVADTGVGIPSEAVPHVFERFWQANRNDRRGLGMGLPIVKGIVEAHGGKIGVDSNLGVGTTFYFTLLLGSRKAEASSSLPTSSTKEALSN